MKQTEKLRSIKMRKKAKVYVSQFAGFCSEQLCMIYSSKQSLFISSSYAELCYSPLSAPSLTSFSSFLFMSAFF